MLLQSGLTDRYLDALARAAAAEPTPARVTRLVELYRLHGRVDGEINTLQAYAGSGILEVSQLERLGALLAERGDWRNARRWLEMADLHAPQDASAGRFLLLEVLILGDEVDLIDKHAEVWLTEWRSPYLSGRLILRIAQSGHASAATRLALEYVDMSPNDALGMVSLLASRGYQRVARQALVRWADGAAEADETRLRTFVQASAAIGGVDVALQKFLRLARSGSSAAMAGQLAEDLVNSFGSPVQTAIRPYLSNEVLATRPLFAAEISLSERNPELARRYLARIDPSRLSSEDLTKWLALSHDVQMDADAFLKLAVLWSHGHLPKELAPYLAEQAEKLGQPALHDLIWRSLRQ